MVEFRNVILVTVASLLVAACTSTSVDVERPDPPKDSVPVPYSQVWSAEPGIDLFSRGAELVRASLEAGYYAYFYSLGTTFPGYGDAVGAPYDVDGEEVAVNLAPYGRGTGTPGPFTLRYHIANIDESASEVTADVCYDSAGLEPATFEKPWRVGLAWVVTLKNDGGTPGLPGIADTDAEGSDPRAVRVPDWNVFGTWRITQMRTGGRDWNGAHPACTDWWLERYPGASVRYGHPYPDNGFVASGMPVAQQYPEWIGQANPQ